MSKKYRVYRIVFGIFLAFAVFAFFSRSTVLAEGEPATSYPDLSHVCNSSNANGYVCSPSSLYLAVGNGEHTSGVTAVEIYVQSAGNVTINIENPGVCPTDTGGGSTFDFDSTGSNTTKYQVAASPSPAYLASYGECGTYAFTFLAPVPGAYAFTAKVRDSSGNTGPLGNIENQFRLQVTSGNATIGAGSRSLGGLSIANSSLPYSNVRASWSTYAMYFAADCSLVAGNYPLQFYDADYGKYQGPRYDGDTYYRDLQVALLGRVTGSGSAWTTITPLTNLTGGDGVYETTVVPKLALNTEYRLEIYGLTRPNALEVSIPDGFSQGGVGKPCGSIASACKVTAPVGVNFNDVRPNATVGINIEITNVSGAAMTFGANNGDFSSLGIIDPNDPTAASRQSPPSPDEPIKFPSAVARAPTALALNQAPYPRFTGSSTFVLNPGQSYTFTISITAPGAAGTYPIGFRVLNRELAPNDWVPMDPNCKTNIVVIIPVNVGICQVYAVSGSLEPGDTYTPQMIVVNGSQPGSGPITETVSVTINGPGISSTLPGIVLVVAEGTTSPVLNFTPVTLNQTGIFTVSGTMSGTVTKGCNNDISVKVKTRPYLKVYGGDVGAGVGLCSPSVPDATATIKAFDKPNGGGRSGSSSEYAAFAYAAIVSNGFYTKSASASATGDDLTFANNIASPGGSFMAQPSCEDDYYNTAKPSVITSSASISGSLCGSLAVGGVGVSTQYDINPNPAGRFRLDNSCGPISGKVAVFVKGDVLVNGNIMYSTAGQSSPDKLPSFVLVATGNIYINSTVTQLSGMYIAQGRTIYTCSTGNYAAPDLASSSPQSVLALCNNQLTVHGALMANKIRFLRAQNTLKNSNNDGAGLNKASYPTYSSTTKAAEVFVTGPEMYLSQPALRPRQSVSSSTFDGIASLAPIF